MPQTVLLLLPAASYRNEDFLAAARRLDVEVIAAADYCPRLAPAWGMTPIEALHFDQPQAALETLLAHLPRRPDAVLAVDDHGLELAALLRERLRLPGNPPGAIVCTRDKFAFRRLLAAHGFNCPAFHLLAADDEPQHLAGRLRYPVVVKARRLSSSRGVVRADDGASFLAAVRQVRAIQGRADREHEELGILVEDFIPGMEYALEGVLHEGRLTALALFDKPDPLDGPYFEETVYVTPSRLPQATQAALWDVVARACRAAGLVSGPVHAEARVNAQGIWLLELAARSIGGLCGRILRHALGMSLEELVLREALRRPLPRARVEGGLGVMMIPIPRRGIYLGVDGLAQARAVPGVSGVEITATPGTLLLPVPEGASYLGFIFAVADTPAAAEGALRMAHRQLRLQIRPETEIVAQS